MPIAILLLNKDSVTIDSKFKVAATDLELVIRYPYYGYKERLSVKKAWDWVSKDSTVVQFVKVSTSLQGIELIFTNNKVVPRLYEWSDAGGATTKTDFKNFSLTINKTCLKLGDTLQGKIDGIAFRKVEDDFIRFKIKGTFRHIIENSPEKQRQLLLKAGIKPQD